MSLKSIFCVGLLCVIASPVLAAGPELSISNGGLDGDGNWVWNVTVAPDSSLFSDRPPDGLGGSVAVELGITAGGSDLISITPDIVNFPKDLNPGTDIPGFPNGDGVNIAGNLGSIFLGSEFFTTDTPKQVVTIVTTGPSTTGSLTSDISVSGAYSNNGRIAQAGATPPGNFDVFTGIATRTAVPGDANLTIDGVGGAAVGLADLQIVASQLNRFPGVEKVWNEGDFNGVADGVGGSHVGLADLQIVASCLNRTSAGCTGENTPLTVSAPAAGGGSFATSSAAVPEPSTAILLALAALGMTGSRRRKS